MANHWNVQELAHMIPHWSLWRLSSMDYYSWHLKDFSTLCASHFKMRVRHFAQLGILMFVHSMLLTPSRTIWNLAKDITNCWLLVVDSTFSTVERVEHVMFCSTPMKSLTVVFLPGFDTNFQVNLKSKVDPLPSRLRPHLGLNQAVRYHTA